MTPIQQALIAGIVGGLVAGLLLGVYWFGGSTNGEK
jgi:uncharacterized membrane-anchored protein YitT (DUF2179 family)